MQALRQRMNESMSAMDEQFAAVNQQINQAMNDLSNAINNAVEAVANAFNSTFQQPLQLPPFPDTMGGYAPADARSRRMPLAYPTCPSLSTVPHIRHVPRTHARNPAPFLATRTSSHPRIPRRTPLPSIVNGPCTALLFCLRTYQILYSR